ncbi:hypothetical protein ACOME3_004212 [Neoechinorhynchus agilis]
MDKPFATRADELSMENGIVMHLQRMIIPFSLRKSVMKILHNGHPRDRSHEINMPVLRMVARHRVGHPTQGSELLSLPNSPVKHATATTHAVGLSIRSLGTCTYRPGRANKLKDVLSFGGRQEQVARRLALQYVPNNCRNGNRPDERVVCSNGIPKKIVNDNGPQLMARQFTKFCEENGIQVIQASPYNSQTNGLVERFIGTLKRRGMASVSTDTRKILNEFLQTYRNTPHAITGKAPAEILLG